MTTNDLIDDLRIVGASHEPFICELEYYLEKTPVLPETFDDDVSQIISWHQDAFSDHDLGEIFGLMVRLYGKSNLSVKAMIYSLPGGSDYYDIPMDMDGDDWGKFISVRRGLPHAPSQSFVPEYLHSKGLLGYTSMYQLCQDYGAYGFSWGKNEVIFYYHNAEDGFQMKLTI